MNTPDLKKSDRERIITIIRGKMQDLCSGRHKDASSYQVLFVVFFCIMVIGMNYKN